jgi:guanine nucleotide-binding protein G(i) subunit alpha
MGNHLSRSEKKEKKEKKKRNKEINKQLEKEKSMLKNEVKLLLLGAGESGKSTILKQMRLIYDNGYGIEERISYREIIFSNTFQSMRVLCEAMINLNISYGDDKTELLGRLMRESNIQLDSGETPYELLKTIKILWQDPGIQRCYQRSREFQLNDSAK